MYFCFQKNGKRVDGFTITEDENIFQNVNDPRMSRFVGDRKRAVFKLKLTGEIIERFDSCAAAAYCIFNEGRTSSSVERTKDGILSCPKGCCSNTYGYRWVFVENWLEEVIERERN